MYAKSFALAGLAGSFVVAASASASYTGFTVEAYNGGSDAQNWLDNGYAGLTTYRMYANFVEDGEDDGVLSVFGIDGVTISMNSWDGTFHNDLIFGGLTAPNRLVPPSQRMPARSLSNAAMAYSVSSDYNRPGSAAWHVPNSGVATARQ